MTKFDRNLIILESSLLFVFWIVVFLLGADFPPPVGFWKIVVLTLILDIVQAFYLRFLLKNITTRPTYIINSIFFVLGGIIVSLPAIWQTDTEVQSKVIWVSIVTFVSVIYGNIFWIFNKIAKTKDNSISTK